MGYPRIEKTHRFVCVCLFSPLEHASSMAKYLNNHDFMIADRRLVSVGCTVFGSCRHHVVDFCSSLPHTHVYQEDNW